MRKSCNTTNQKCQHVKKHDHSILGKHTKEEKLICLIDMDDNDEMKFIPEISDENCQLEHVKKHDHSFLGKHTKEEKEKYLCDLAKK